MGDIMVTMLISYIQSIVQHHHYEQHKQTSSIYNCEWNQHPADTVSRKPHITGIVLLHGFCIGEKSAPFSILNVLIFQSHTNLHVIVYVRRKHHWLLKLKLSPTLM